MGGLALWRSTRHLHHTYSFWASETYRQVSSEPLPTGVSPVRIAVRFPPTRRRLRWSGDPLWADDRLIGREGEVPRRLPLAPPPMPGMDASAATTAWSLTAAMRTRRPMRSPGPSPRSSSTSSQYPSRRALRAHRSKRWDRAPQAERLSRSVLTTRCRGRECCRFIVLMVCLAGCGGDQRMPVRRRSSSGA